VANGNVLSGVRIQDGYDNVVGGCVDAPGEPPGNVISGNGFTAAPQATEDGIVILGVAHGNRVEGNVIGLGIPNARDGVRIVDGPSMNVIGGTPGPNCEVRNVISSNGSNGIFVSGGSPGNRIAGNYIGTSLGGEGDAGNSGAGVAVSAAPGTVIGGASAEERNVISGNLAGICLTGASGTVIRGNYIGLDDDGEEPLGNTGSGVELSDGASNNQIGGPGDGQANVIAFNGFDGVDVEGSAGNGNRISRNQIFNNGFLGIDLGVLGPTPNDPDDPDPGPNATQNYPCLIAATRPAGGGAVTIHGSLDGTPMTLFTVEFFATLPCDDTGYGEGGSFIGSHMVSTGAGPGANDAVINVSFPVDLGLGLSITATATDPMNNTSEFSDCVTLFEGAVGDVNGDGVVDVQDLVHIITNWGPCPPGPACAADLNGDGVVDVQDLVIVIVGWS
jgi:hypothetical protein